MAASSLPVLPSGQGQAWPPTHCSYVMSKYVRHGALALWLVLLLRGVALQKEPLWHSATSVTPKRIG